MGVDSAGATLKTIPSVYFGPLEHDRSAEIYLPFGLPGFEEESCLVAIEIPDQRPLVYLQSTSNPALCFLSLPTNSIESGWKLELSEEDRCSLMLDPEEELVHGKNIMSLAILFPVRGVLQVNLCAPLVIGLRKMIGVQRLPATAADNRRLELRDSGDWVEVC